MVEKDTGTSALHGMVGGLSHPHPGSSGMGRHAGFFCCSSHLELGDSGGTLNARALWLDANLLAARPQAVGASFQHSV